MTTFLNWKNYEPRSRERLITDLFSYLSPRWYPVNVIGTDTYYIFKMYADQLSSASLESQQIFEDLFIKSVTSNPTTGRSVSKMYDNFGSLFEVNKLFEQDYEEYNQIYYLQSYRQQLRFLSEAYFNDPVIKSIKLVGQSYNGISPVIEESSRDILGWKLQTVTGSILSVGDNIVILDKIIPRIGNIYPLATSSVVGDSFTYTYSKLGVNTKLIGTKRYNSGIDLYIFASGGGNTSFQNSIENSINNVLKSDIISRYYYSDQFVIWKPSTSSLPLSTTVFSYAGGGYIYNNTYINSVNEIYLDLVPGSEITGEITPFYKWSITSDVIGLPVNYNENYTWYYDWSVLTRNDTSYKVYLRSYPQEDIPDTVYFKEYRSKLNQGLLLSEIEPSGSLEGIGHWMFTTLSRANDISGNSNDLTQISGSITTEYILPREQAKLGWKLQTGIINLAKTVYDNELDLYNENFLWEGWIYGVDSNFQQADNFFIFKREIPSTGSVETPVSGSIITFGDPAILNNFVTVRISSFIYDTSHFITCFYNSYSNKGEAFIGTVSGTDILVSPYYAFATGAVNYVSATLLDSTHFIVSYKEASSTNYGISKIGTVSGSVITFGSPYIFNADFTGYISTNKIDDNNFLNLYSDGSSSQNGVAIIGTVSGSIISFGTPYEFSTEGVTELQGKVIDSSNFIMAYTDVTDDYNGKVRTGAISGSVITFGLSSTIDCNDSFYNPSIVVLDTTNFVISYEDLLVSVTTGAVIKGTISGSTVLLESPYIYNPYPVYRSFISRLNSTKFLLNYSDSNQGYAGISSVMEVSGSVITHNPLFNYIYSINPVQATDASVFDANTYVITFCLSDTTGVSVLGIINEGSETPSSSVSSFGNYLFTDGYAFVIDSDSTSFGLHVKNGSNSGSISGSILDYISEDPYRPHYFSCLNIYDNIYLNIDNKTIATGTLGINLPFIPSVSTGSIQLQSNAIDLGIDEIYLSTGSIIPGYTRTRFTESSPKVYSRKLFEPDQYHQIQTQVYGAGANEFEFHQFSLRGVETPFSTSSVLLPLFSIGSGSEMLGYKGNFIEDFGYHI